MSDTSPEPAPSRRPHLIRRLYDWVLSWSDSRYGTAALVLLAVVESSFFIIPPDVLLIALALSKPKKSFRFAAWCTLGSVVGGVLGYLIGWGLWASVGPFVLDHVFSPEKWCVLELPNPMGERTRNRFQMVGRGSVRLRFERG